MHNNSLGDKGIAAICEAVQSNEGSKLASLTLSENGIGPVGAKSVAAMLAVKGVLARIDVSHNSLGEDGKALLQEAVKGRSGFVLKL